MADNDLDGDRGNRGDDRKREREQRQGRDRIAVESGADGLESAVAATDLAVGYPATEEPVVDIGRIDVPAGEITVLVGPNGSGKSTLLKALAAHLEPERGTVRLHGRDLEAVGRQELARELGHLSQENESPEGLTVEDLATHGRYPHRGFLERLSAEDEAAVERALDLAGVAALRDRELGQLSGGQRQLAWLAMVLAQEPDVLLLDEPTTFLDMRHQLRVLETLRRLNAEESVTVAVVLHDIGQAARFADYLVAMREGDLYDWGPPVEVVTEDLLADVFRVDAAVRREPTLGSSLGAR
jgi:iron complex transport system ATP-binding protein